MKRRDFIKGVWWVTECHSTKFDHHYSQKFKPRYRLPLGPPFRSDIPVCSLTRGGAGLMSAENTAGKQRGIVTLSVTPAPSTAIEPSGSSEVFRYVRHADVPRFEAEGWELLPALDGTHHGEYSVLMRRVEQKL